MEKAAWRIFSWVSRVIAVPWLNDQSNLLGHSIKSRPTCQGGQWELKLGENNFVSRAVEELNRRMLRARDAIDRSYAQPLDIPALASVASVSEAHFIRTFRSTFAETPHRYLQRRRVGRAMFLLSETERNITDICLDVGVTSLGTLSRMFPDIVGVNPTDYLAREIGRAHVRTPVTVKQRH